jgi:ribosome-associated protein
MDDLAIKNGIVIPAHELEINAARAGGPGGQHVNKTSTKIIVRWNVTQSQALTPEQKTRVLEKLASQITKDGFLVVQSSESRSQAHNKKLALDRLAILISKSLHVAKKRKKTKIPEAIEQSRLEEKKRRGTVKKLRHIKYED